MDITANTREYLNAFFELLLQRMKSLKPKKSLSHDPLSTQAGKEAAEIIEKFLHEEPDDRKKVFQILGKIYPQFANDLAIALHSITGEKTIFRNLLISLIIQAEDWDEKDRKATYRMVAGLWVRHNDKTKKEIIAMLIQRDCNQHMHGLIRFLRDTKHPLYAYVKDMLPPMD